MPKHRLYVDEVGSSGRRPSNDPHGRYLSLSGVALELSYVESTFAPALEALKKAYFNGHPDDPVILHRSDLVKRRPPFDVLNDPAVVARFDGQLMQLFERSIFTVFTVVVDKTAFAATFPTTRPDPYQRCLELMVSHFAVWLERGAASGDVLAESRGGNEDQRLKESFRQVLTTAESVHPHGPLATRLTSRELKVKPKANNIAGLQLADLIAHPALLAATYEHDGRERRGDYGGRLITLLEHGKYARDPQGEITGFGRLWIP